MTRVRFFLVILAASVLLTAVVADAQTTGSIRGKITDNQGDAIAGATVTVRSEALINGQRVTTSGANGGYSFPGLQVGEYTVRAELQGFQSQAIEGLRVRVNATATVSFTLAPAFSDEVEVRAEAPIVDFTSSSIETGFTADFIEDLPLPRYFWDSMALSPGVTKTFDNNQPSIIAFGTGVQSNAWMVDGINTNAPRLGSAWWYLNPDVVEEVQVMGPGAPAEFGNMLGAALNVVTKSGGNDLNGTFNAYWQTDDLTDANVTLEGDPFPEYQRERFFDLTGSLGGPIQRDRLWFFVSAQSSRDAFSEPGNNPDFAPENQSDKVGVKLSAQLTENSTLVGSFHQEEWLQPEPGNAFKTLDALFQFEGTNPAWAASYTNVLSGDTFLEAKYAGWWGDIVQESQTGSTEPAFIDLTPPGGGPPVQSGGVLFPFRGVNQRDQLDVTVSHFADQFLEGSHDFKFGVQYTLGENEAQVAAGPEGAYFTSATYGTTTYNTMYVLNPYLYGADSEGVSLFVDDSWQVNDKLTLNLGLRWDRHEGAIPDFQRLDSGFQPTGEEIPGIDSAVEWSNLSPRLGFAYNFDGRTVVHGSFGVYHDGMVTGNWDIPPPQAPPFQIFFQNPATGAFDILLFESAAASASIDPDLDAPRNLQYTLGFERQLGANKAFGAQLIYKETEDLVGWEILDDGVYDPFPWTNPVTGETETLLATVEAPTVRKGNRPGFTVLGPDTEYYQDYRGLILTFDKRHSNGWSLQSSYTWSKSEGLIPRQFSNFQNNILLLSRNGTDPNHWLNADQLLQGDREHMFRILANVDLPWGLRATTVVNLQSGRAFARQMRVRVGGRNTNVTAVSANDDQRYPSQELVDVSLGKRFTLGGTTLKVDAQIFNLLNDDAVDRWATLFVSDSDEFVPRSYVAPRRLMLRIGLEF